MKEKILLHACCAPCTTAVLRKLRSEDFIVNGMFYNPNIHPKEEFDRRLATYKSFIAKEELNSIVDDSYDIDLYNREVTNKEGDRCVNCYKFRLERTASCAKDNKFDHFTTTLLISPYQKHDEIRRIGEDLSKKYDVGFYYLDFRLLYRQSRELSKIMDLYRQKYCGCYISLDEMIDRKKQAGNKKWQKKE